MNMLSKLFVMFGTALLAMAGVVRSSNPTKKHSGPVVKLVLPLNQGGETAGDILSEANPFGVQCRIIDASLVITVASGGAATADIGVAANGTTTASNIFDGVDINAAATYNPTDDSGTNGLLDTDPGVIWESSEFITGDILTGVDGAIEAVLTVWCVLGQ